jgi:type II secretory pathway predicted ATPase ExeA
MLLRLLLAELSPATPRWIIPHGRAETAAELYQAILFDLGLPYQGRSPQELRLAVWEALVSAERPVMLIVDEAQHLGEEAIEEVRLLTSFGSFQGAAVVPILAAQSGFLAKLCQPALQAFAARVGHHCRLEAWNEEESLAFLRWHWQQAMLPVEEEALAWIARVCQGNAHRLVQLSLEAERLAQVGEASCVDGEAVWEAIQQLGFSPGMAEETGVAERTQRQGQEEEVGEGIATVPPAPPAGDNSRFERRAGSKDQVSSPVQTKEVTAPGGVPEVEAA